MVISNSVDAGRRVYVGVGRHPNPIARAAAVALLLLIAVPVFLLILFAAFFATIAFAALSLVSRGGAALHRWRDRVFPRRDGRRNVRVVYREG